MVRLHLYELFRMGKSAETENRGVRSLGLGAGGGRGLGKREWWLVHAGFPFGVKRSKMHCGHGCITIKCIR